MGSLEEQTLFADFGEVRQVVKCTAETLKDVQLDLRARNRTNLQYVSAFITILFACLGAVWGLVIEPIKEDISQSVSKDVFTAKLEHMTKEQARLANSVEKLNQTVVELHNKLATKGAGK